MSHVNPFLQTNLSSVSSTATPASSTPVYAKLPASPRTASPVPHLTSLYHFANAGEYGDRSYPGNCGGNLINDLLRFYQPATVFDPMTGSGTGRDVCKKLEIPCVFADLQSGFDATNPDAYAAISTERGFGFIWAHPPYWRQKIYSENPQDMSQARNLDAFLESYGIFIRESAKLLSPGGKFAILIGDYRDRINEYIPLTYYTKQLAFESGLRLAAPDIIRFSHGASSGRKTYPTSFIPQLHDVCMVFESPSSR